MLSTSFIHIDELQIVVIHIHRHICLGLGSIWRSTRQNFTLLVHQTITKLQIVTSYPHSQLDRLTFLQRSQPLNQFKSITTNKRPWHPHSIPSPTASPSCSLTRPTTKPPPPPPSLQLPPKESRPSTPSHPSHPHRTVHPPLPLPPRLNLLLSPSTRLLSWKDAMLRNLF